MNGMYPNMMGPGMVPNPYFQQTVQTKNWLSDEDIAKLQKGSSQFSLSVTEQDVARARCNHYNPLVKGGASTLVVDPDGSGRCTCSICGTQFNCRDFSSDEVKTFTNDILDVLNTIKIMYISMDPNAALDFFQIIPFIEKIPQLYDIAVNDFKRYEGVDSFIPGSQSINPFNIYAMMTTPGYGMMPPAGYYQQPMMNQPMMQPQPPMAQPMNAPIQNPYMQAMNQPMMQPQPPMNPGMNAGFAQPNPAYNPMYANPASGGYQPQMTGFSVNATGAAAPVNTNMPNAANPTGVNPAPAADKK